MLERPPPPRFRRVVSVGLSLLLLAGVSSPAWGDTGDRNFTYCDPHIVGDCASFSYNYNCEVTYDLKCFCSVEANGYDPYTHCYIRERPQIPYSTGLMKIFCEYRFSSTPDRGIYRSGYDSITVDCGEPLTLQLTPKEKRNLILGKEVKSVTIQSFLKNSSAREVKIQGRVEAVSAIPKERQIDLYSFVPSIL